MSEGKPEPRSGDQEPSMEEILSSIRKIIASEEEADRPAAGENPAPAATADEGADVLELTEVVSAAEQEEPGQQASALAGIPGKAPAEEAVLGLAGLEERARAAVEEAARRIETVVEDPEMPSPAVADTGDLVSASAASAATAAFAKLARSVSRGDKAAAIPDSGKSVEAFVAELLRPMLKDWLDANLPTIVERVVEQEVRKLARRAELL